MQITLSEAFLVGGARSPFTPVWASPAAPPALPVSEVLNPALSQETTLAQIRTPPPLMPKDHVGGRDKEGREEQKGKLVAFHSA